MDRRTLFAALPLALAAVPAAAQTPQANRALADRYAAALTAHDMDAFAALFAPDYRNHQVSAAAPPPPANHTEKQATIGFFAARIKGLPDLTVHIEALVADADSFAASFIYEGTQTGPLLGIAPTGKRMRFTSCDIFRIDNGLIAEHWGMGDIAGQLAQLKG
jgi:steroid delta-isomerase-like uncharacterized protein